MMGGFQAIQVQQQGSGGHGKGGLGSGGKGASTTTNYTVDFQMAIGEGPIAGFGAVWKDQSMYNPSALGLTESLGAYAQAPWSYLQTKYGYTYPYSGIAWAGASPFQLGTSANMSNLNFEVCGILFGSGANGYDADPASVIFDFLTNPHYGAGFPPSRFGTLVTASESHTIPGSAPYQIVTTHYNNFQYSLCVVDGAGNLYTAVAASPGHQQYTVNNGVYTFGAVDAGTALTTIYTFQTGLFQYSAFTWASGLCVSPVYSSQQQASAMVDELATNTYGSLVWSSGMLTIVPRGTMSVSGNGVTYNAPTQPVVDLSDDDFVENQGSGSGGSSMTDPIIITRTRPSDQINNIKLEAVDNNNQYAPVVVEVTDQALIDKFGRRAKASSQVHFFTRVGVAHTAAQLLLQDQYIRNTYTFTTDQRYALLDPMDIVTVSQSSATMPLNRQWVRITEITENDDGTLTFVADEYPAGTGAAAQYVLNQGNGSLPDFNVDPGFVNAPIFFIPPMELTNAPNPEIYMAISGAAQNWGGCDVYISTDNNTYTYVGTQTGPTRQGGVVAGSLATLTDPDNTTDTITIDLTESRGQLTSGSQADADRFNTMCYLGGEIISYTNAALVGPNIYQLSGYLRRGIYHTLISNHPLGTGFFRIDNGVFIFPIDKDQMTQTFYVKFCSFNIYGGHKQLISDVTPYSFVPSGTPLLTAPTNFTVTATGVRSLTLKWTNPPQRSLAGIEIWRYNPTPNTWSLIASVGIATTTFIDSNLVPGTTYSYMINGIDLSGNPGPQTGFVSGTASGVVAGDLAPQSVGTPALAPLAVSTPIIANNAVTSLTSGGGATANPAIYATTVFNMSSAGAADIIFSADCFGINSQTGDFGGLCLVSLVVDGSTRQSLGGINGFVTWSQPISLAAGTHTAYLNITSQTTGDLTNVNTASITIITLYK